MRLIEQGRLPDNIELVEFFLEPGAWLNSAPLQQHYLSSNYTHVARDALRRGLNVIAQLVARPPAGEAPAGLLSLGANPDLTADLLPQIAQMRASGQPFALIGQVHAELPFMYGVCAGGRGHVRLPARRSRHAAVLSAERPDPRAPSTRSR